MDLKSKFVNIWTKIRLCPICAFCVHHVTELFNEQSMCVIDWLPSNVFMKKNFGDATKWCKVYIFI